LLIDPARNEPRHSVRESFDDAGWETGLLQEVAGREFLAIATKLF
jgi:hypothetical protein